MNSYTLSPNESVNSVRLRSSASISVPGALTRTRILSSRSASSPTVLAPYSGSPTPFSPVSSLPRISASFGRGEKKAEGLVILCWSISPA